MLILPYHITIKFEEVQVCSFRAYFNFHTFFRQHNNIEILVELKNYKVESKHSAFPLLCGILGKLFGSFQKFMKRPPPSFLFERFHQTFLKNFKI